MKIIVVEGKGFIGFMLRKIFKIKKQAITNN